MKMRRRIPMLFVLLVLALTVAGAAKLRLASHSQSGSTVDKTREPGFKDQQNPSATPQPPVTPQAIGGIDPHTIAGGGGTSSSGSIRIDGTIGQAITSPTASGGQFTLSGGFWNAVDTSISSPSPTPSPSPSPSASPTPTHILTVASSSPSSGVSIAVSPNDNAGHGDGTTPLTRTYNNNQIVNLAAPAAAGVNNFQKWLKDGADFATVTNVSVDMDVDHTMTAVYVVTTNGGPSLFVEQGDSTQLAALDSVTC